MKEFNVIVPVYANRIEIELAEDDGLFNYFLIACDTLPSGYGPGDGIFTVMLFDEAGTVIDCGSKPIMDVMDTAVELKVLCGAGKNDDEIKYKHYQFTVRLIEGDKIHVNVKELNH